MTHRSFYMSTSKADGFQITFVNRSISRDVVMNVSDKLCDLTRHRFCNLHMNVINWADKKEERLLSIPATREQLHELAWDKDNDWWPGDPDEDDEDLA